MSVQSLYQKETGHAIGLAYLTDIAQGGGLESVVAGDGIGVDNTNPLNPIITNTGIRRMSGGAGITIDLTNQYEPIVYLTNGVPIYLTAGDTGNWVLTPFANGDTINTITFVNTYFSHDVVASFNTSFVFEANGTSNDDDI